MTKAPSRRSSRIAASKIPQSQQPRAALQAQPNQPPARHRPQPSKPKSKPKHKYPKWPGDGKFKEPPCWLCLKCLLADDRIQSKCRESKDLSNLTCNLCFTRRKKCEHCPSDLLSLYLELRNAIQDGDDERRDLLRKELTALEKERRKEAKQGKAKDSKRAKAEKDAGDDGDDEDMEIEEEDEEDELDQGQSEEEDSGEEEVGEGESGEEEEEPRDEILWENEEEEPELVFDTTRYIGDADMDGTEQEYGYEEEDSEDDPHQRFLAAWEDKAWQLSENVAREMIKFARDNYPG